MISCRLQGPDRWTFPACTEVTAYLAMSVGKHKPFPTSAGVCQWKEEFLFGDLYFLYSNHRILLDVMFRDSGSNAHWGKPFVFSCCHLKCCFLATVRWLHPKWANFSFVVMSALAQGEDLYHLKSKWRFIVTYLGNAYWNNILICTPVRNILRPRCGALINN